MKENSERGSIGRKDDDFADTTVQGLGSLVGALLQLAVVTYEKVRILSKR